MVHWLIKLFQRKKKKKMSGQKVVLLFFFFLAIEWIRNVAEMRWTSSLFVFWGGGLHLLLRTSAARGSRRLRGAPHGPVVLTSHFCQHQLSSVAVGTRKVKGGSVHMWQGHTHGLHACCDKQGWTVVTRSGHRQEHKLVLDQLTCA